MYKEIYLLLGSNMGNRLDFLQFAKKEIELNVGNVEAESSIYETEAWGLENQNAFLNQVLKVKSLLSPSKILSAAQKIENKAQRQREVKWGARTLDIDILFIDSKNIELKKLTVPHPFLHKRLFTLAPLSEIAPNFVHPLLQKTMQELLTECDKNLKVEIYSGL